MVGVSLVLPCRNEEKTIELCIRQIKEVFRKEKIKGEIIVSDSSTDRSAKIAKKLNTKVVKHDKAGYGIACQIGLEKAQGHYIIIGDSDGTYDFSQIPLFIKKLKNFDLVIGSRLNGKIKKNAMPILHRYFGNPILSAILNLFFKTNISDTQSGFRGIRKTALDKLNFNTKGMEFASEMIILASKAKLKIGEVPISYSPRIGESSLRSFSDGWRHLRFMLMFSPTYLFLVPGAALFAFGLIFSTFNNSRIIFLGPLLSIVGYQVFNLGLYSKLYAIHSGFEEHDKLTDIIAKHVSLERGILLGFIVLIAAGFGFLLNSLFSFTLFIIGFQTLFSVFFISMMLVEKK